MITLALEPEDELAVLQAETLATAIKNQARLIESEPWTFDAMSIQAVVERKAVRNVMTWRKSWKLNGSRIGHNALMGKLRKMRESAST